MNEKVRKESPLASMLWKFMLFVGLLLGGTSQLYAQQSQVTGSIVDAEGEAMIGVYNYSYSISHVKNAINIPYYNLLNNYSHYLNKNKRYYLYCEEGKQSLEISKRLNAFGYDTLSITGGFISFK